ncbi:MAG TPA: hypothetical protein VGF13_23215 [Verrucomicrobiae bacterium]|jgi:hypothetical protein
MKFFGNIFGSFSRHWEKVLLALSLVALIGAVGWLIQEKSKENEKIENYNKAITRRKPNLVPTVDITQLAQAQTQAMNPPSLTFSPPHNLVNPVKWQQRADKTRIKAETGKELGINAMQITKISPLRLIISLETQAGSGANMGVMQEASTTNYYRQKLQAYVTTNSVSERVHRTTRAFSLRDLRITPEGPEADIELTDGTKATVTPSKPYARVDGYKADLSYPPEGQTFKDRRVGDPLTVANEKYKIVAINPNEVVVSADSNDRRTTIQNKATQ